MGQHKEKLTLPAQADVRSLQPRTVARVRILRRFQFGIHFFLAMVTLDRGSELLKQNPTGSMTRKAALDEIQVHR